MATGNQLFQVDYGISQVKFRKGVGVGKGTGAEDKTFGDLQIKRRDKMRKNKDKEDQLKCGSALGHSPSPGLASSGTEAFLPTLTPVRKCQKKGRWAKKHYPPCFFSLILATGPCKKLPRQISYSNCLKYQDSVASIHFLKRKMLLKERN